MMNNLPIEVLEQIYIHSAVAETCLPFYHETKTPFPLSQVNRTFRTISQDNVIKAKILLRKQYPLHHVFRQIQSFHPVKLIDGKPW